MNQQVRFALNSCADWRCRQESGKPVVDRVISEGLSNESYLVRWNKQRFILRLFSHNSLHFAAVEAEIKISLQAHGAGLAPQQVYSSLEHRFVVTEYIEGAHWTVSQSNDPNNIQRVAALLQAVHRLPKCERELVLPDIIDKYHTQLADTEWLHTIRCEWQNQLRNFAVELRSTLDQLVSCHNDLVLENIIDTGSRLYIIDWEYAALCDPMYEIAVIALNHQLGADQIQLLMLAYFSEIKDQQRQRFERMYLVAAYIDYLWYAAQSLIDESGNCANTAETKLEFLQLLLTTSEIIEN